MVFFQLDDEDALPYVCHLLYLITTRRSVTPYRSRRLLELYQRSLHTGQMVRPLFALLQLYSQYDPSLLLPRPPKSSLGYGQFRQVDESWSAALAALHRRAAESGESARGGETEDGSQPSAALSFRMGSQLSLQSHLLFARGKRFFQVPSARRTHAQWPHTTSLWLSPSGPTGPSGPSGPQASRGRRSRGGASGPLGPLGPWGSSGPVGPGGVEWVTLEQVNSPAELLAALQRRRVRLLPPDQSLSLLAPAVARLALLALRWALPAARLDWALPAALRSLLLQDRLPRGQRASLLAFLRQSALFRGDLDPAVQTVLATVVETFGFREREAVFLAAFLPVAALRALLPRFKMEFQGSPRGAQAEMASRVVGCCAMLRSLVGPNEPREQRQKLDLFERLLESCVLMAAENGSANTVASVVVSYMVVQFYNESIRQHVFIPSEDLVRVLVLSDNASVVDGCLQFIQKSALGRELRRSFLQADERQGRSVELEAIAKSYLSRERLLSNMVPVEPICHS